MGGYRVVETSTGTVLATFGTLEAARAYMRRKHAEGIACDVRTWTWGAAVLAVGAL